MTEGASHTERGQLLIELIRELIPLHVSVLAVGDEISGSLGVTRSLWQVLDAIKDTSLSVPQISRVLGLARQSVQRSVGILHGNSLVELIANPHHKSSPLVRLTGQTRSKMQELTNLQTAWANRVAENLALDEMNIAISVLRALRISLDCSRHD